jgi:hypothetical protein
MTSNPDSPNTEPETNPDADEDPNTETPVDGDSTGAPADNPSGSAIKERNEDQGDDAASGGS